MIKAFHKIFLLCITFCLVHSVNALSQSKIPWDSTYRPEVYNMLVERFQSFPPGKKDVVFLGNSITFWGDWKERLKSWHIKNQGIPGDITFGVLQRLKEAMRGKPSKIFIPIGINDIAHHIPDSVILKNYVRIIDGIHEGSPSTKIFFQTLLPTNASFHKLPGYYHREKDILKINAGLKKIAAKKDVTFINLYPHFADTSGNLIKDYTWDGVHLTQKGYAEWIKFLKDRHYLN